MSQERKIRKAVFPVAGLGTRFLPATKAVPKEMLTVVDKPVIQYVVDEAAEAGIEHFVFVTGRGKGVIEDYFDIQFELEQMLRERNKNAELTLLSHILPKAGTASFTRQQEKFTRPKPYPNEGLRPTAVRKEPCSFPVKVMVPLR